MQLPSNYEILEVLDILEESDTGKELIAKLNKANAGEVKGIIIRETTEEELKMFLADPDRIVNAETRFDSKTVR